MYMLPPTLCFSGLVQRERLALGPRADRGRAPMAVEVGALLLDGEARRLEEPMARQDALGLGNLYVV